MIGFDFLFGGCFFVFFYEEFVIVDFEAYFYEYGVSALKWEHAVFCEVFWQVNQVFSVFPSEQPTSSFFDHFVYTSLKLLV